MCRPLHEFPREENVFFCAGLDFTDGTNTTLCSEGSVSSCLETPRSQKHLGMGTEMVAGEETGQNIVKHLVKNYKWITAFSL